MRRREEGMKGRRDEEKKRKREEERKIGREEERKRWLFVEWDSFEIFGTVGIDWMNVWLPVGSLACRREPNAAPLI